MKSKKRKDYTPYWFLASFIVLLLPFSFLKVDPTTKKQIGDASASEASSENNAPKSVPVASTPAPAAVKPTVVPTRPKSDVVESEGEPVFANVSLTVLGLDTGDESVFDRPTDSGATVVTRASDASEPNTAEDKTVKAEEPKRIAATPRPSGGRPPVSAGLGKPVPAPKAVDATSPKAPMGRPPVTPTSKPAEVKTETPAKATTTTRVEEPKVEAADGASPTVELVVGDQSNGIVVESPELKAEPDTKTVKPEAFVSEDAVEVKSQKPTKPGVKSSDDGKPAIEILADGSQFETLAGGTPTANTKSTKSTRSTTSKGTRRPSSSSKSKSANGPKFIDLTITTPKEGPVRRVEGMVARTRSKGWPVAVIRSELPDSPWWVQRTTFFQPPYFKIHLRFGNEDTTGGTRYRLVVLMLDTVEEATRFMTADQITAIPEGLRRSRELNFIRK
ncbi:MAG: hypothetical protein CMJ78_10695 [Planctomycetaceae bacterium]|nr:hypothetical protein [Planctomycetaceae bacterium]